MCHSVMSGSRSGGSAMAASVRRGHRRCRFRRHGRGDPAQPARARTICVILEREDDLGGTWHVNRYPGLAVDIASVTYSYSFEPNPYWSRLFAPGAELKQYAEHVADKYDLRRHMRFGATVDGARWDEDAAALGVSPRTAARRCTAATCSPRPASSRSRTLPDIAGIDDFAGKVIHTAAWDDDLRPDRQARRGHRHRRDRRAADPRDRARGSPSSPSTSAPRSGWPRRSTARSRAPVQRLFARLPAHPAARARWPTRRCSR